MTLEFDVVDRLIEGLQDHEWTVSAPRREGEDAWTVQDALAHITARKQDFVAVVRGTPASRRGLGVHAYNHATFEEWHSRPVDELIQWHRRVQRDLLEALSAAPEAWLAREMPPSWRAGVDRHSALHRTRDIERPLRDHMKRR